jgi:RHS repeat-associated protein
MVRESDAFYKPSDPKSGNVIHYGYDGDGNLSSIVDPVGRQTKLKYYLEPTPHAGLLREIEDWHDAKRLINFEYDVNRNLIKVKLPDVVNTSGSRPEKNYEYYSSSVSTYSDKVELRPNLEKLFDPNGIKRVTFEYSPAPLDRDKVVKQTWGTGESATVAYDPTNPVTTVTDVLGQPRKYTFTRNTTDIVTGRGHVEELVEIGVPVWSGASFGQLPGSVTAGEPSAPGRDRVWTFSYEKGMQTGINLQGVSKTTIGYNPAPNDAGSLISNTTTAPATPTAPSAASPWMPADTAITRTFEYQADAPSFLQAITAGSKRIESPEAHRKNVESVVAANDSIKSDSKYEKFGLPKEVSSTGGTDITGKGSHTKIDYFLETAPKHARFLPQFIREGEAPELVTEFQYPSDARTIEIDPRGVITTTDLDTWLRPTRVEVKKPGSLAIITRYEYDATGRLEKVIRNQDGGDVTTTYTYDQVGRTLTTTTDKIATVGSITATNTYNLSSRKTTTVVTGGATTTIEVDKLGRVIWSHTDTGSSPIDMRYAYDLAGNRVYETDLFIASASAYDSNGRLMATRGADGTLTTTNRDEMGRPTDIKAFNPSGLQVVAQGSYSFSPGGRLQSANAKVEASITRSTTTVWDGGGRTTGTATGDRAMRSAYDLGGRPLSHAAGAGSAISLSEIFAKSEISAHEGSLPKAVEISEKGSSEITTILARETTGSVTQINTGSLEWKQEYDELGNLTKANTPGRPMTEWNVDARGAVKAEKLPGGGQNVFTYHASGAQTAFVDATSETTGTETDFIGRPTRRRYQDGTVEIIEWEGRRLKSITDRQGRTQTYSYNSKGQLEEIRSGLAVLDRFAYDDAGRMVSWRTPDSEMTFGPEFDMEGRPKRTKQRRFRNGTGIGTAPPEVLDEFEQQHVYNEHGERIFGSMPVYPGLAIGTGWTTGIAEQYDAMGNVISIARADAPGAGGAAIMSASYRNADRPDARIVTTAGGSSIVRTYSYSPETSQLVSLSVTNAAGVIAGSEVTYDGMQIASAKLLGLASGARYQHWSYDARSRVAASLYGVANSGANPLAGVPGRAKEELSGADFRFAQERISTLDAATRAKLEEKSIDITKIEPPSSSFSEETGHKISKVTRGPEVRPITYSGAERIEDGRFRYDFDVKGRLVRATEIATAAPTRRIEYTYNGAGRVVGRRAEYLSPAGSLSWQLEDRPQILAADGLPADTTFVWDPITDRLVSVFKAGATPADPHGGLLKQIIHGDADYDDPLETATLDPATGAVTHLYPIYDEAGAGSLQAIVNTNGEVVARNLTRDPYGSDDVALAGAAIDGVQFEVKKAGDAVQAITVTMHATEELEDATVASGGRLAAVDTDGRLVRTSAVIPVRVADDPFALQWTLTAAEWTALTDSAPVVVEGAERVATKLSVAATDTLRASHWSSGIPLLPPPAWVEAVKSVFHSDTLPVEVREPLSILTTFINGVPADATQTSQVYEIDSLALLGNPAGSVGLSEDIVSARMHAHPFTEPMTGLNYVRYRWYDPATGTFLSPDPLGYNDSSNLYSFAGGDPVNGRDPRGERAKTRAEEERIASLWERVERLDEDWETEGQATILVWNYTKPLTIARRGSDVPYRWMEVPYLVDSQYGYENARRMMVADITDYEQQIAEADENEAVEFDPLSRRKLERARLQMGVAQIGSAIADALGARSGGRGGRGSVQARRKGTTARPRFPRLKDHAKRHSNVSASKYRAAAEQHMKTGRKFKVRHEGRNKIVYVTRTGPDSFTFTSTSVSGKTIFTHMENVDTAYLRNKGITLPHGF